MAEIIGGELLARLTPGGLRIDQVGLGGGSASIDAMHVAAACAGLPRWTYSLLLAKYCGDSATAREALAGAILFLELSGRVPRGAAVRRMAYAVFEEWLSDSRCYGCAGRGEIRSRSGVVKICAICDGAGRAIPTARRRARRLGISTARFRAHKCESAMNALLHEMYDHQQKGLRHVYRKSIT